LLRRVAARAAVAIALLARPATPQTTNIPHGARPEICDWSSRECATPTTDLARLIQDCMTQVMYPLLPRPQERPDVSADAAAMLCRRTRGADSTRALAGCVRSLLYERSGLGQRREEVQGDHAVQACEHATSLPLAEAVEDCMRRQLYARDGLGARRPDVAVADAAAACRGPPPPPLRWPFARRCRPPQGPEAAEFLQECMRRLLHERDGLGERRPGLTPMAARLACQGALTDEF
jgi:hypothetical protein